MVTVVVTLMAMVALTVMVMATVMALSFPFSEDAEPFVNAGSGSCRLKSVPGWGRKRKAEERLRMGSRMVLRDVWQTGRGR